MMTHMDKMQSVYNVELLLAVFIIIYTFKTQFGRQLCYDM